MLTKILAALTFLADMLRAIGGAAAHQAGQKQARAEDNAERYQDQAAKAEANADIAARHDDAVSVAERMRDGTF